MSSGNYKKKYYKRSFGKYYTYRRIRNIMNTYFRAKLSMELDVIWNNNVASLSPFNAGNIAVVHSMAFLCRQAMSWDGYRALFTFYKPRGVLLEADPKYQNVTYYDTQNNQVHMPYTGQVVIGLTNANAQPQYTEIIDSNHYVTLSTVQKTRAYWPFTIKDFAAMPLPGVDPDAVPYWLAIQQNGFPLAAETRPLWSMRITFYVTFRQSNL